MKIAQDIRPVSYMKAKAADLLAQVNETHRPVIITQSGTPRAVLQDPKSYESMRAAIGLLKLLAQGEEDVRNGKHRPQDEVFLNIAKKLQPRS